MLGAAGQRTLVGVARTDLSSAIQRAAREASAPAHPAPAAASAPSSAQSEPGARGSPEGPAALVAQAPARSDAAAHRAFADTVVGAPWLEHDDPEPRAREVPEGRERREPIDSAARTLVDPPRMNLEAAASSRPSAGHAGTLLGLAEIGALRPAPSAAPSQPQAPARPQGTLLGVQPQKTSPPLTMQPATTPSPGAAAAPRGMAARPPAGEPKGGGRTLLGVAMPGIAPTFRDAEPPPPNYVPAGELGATLGAQAGAKRPGPGHHALVPEARLRKRGKPADSLLAPLPDVARTKARRRATVVLAAAGVLAAGALAFALLYRSAAPVTARVQPDGRGGDALLLGCPSCPDGTLVEHDGERAEVKQGAATLALRAPLAVGESRLAITLDRPGRGRDETVRVPVHVAYRVTPDLSPLAGETPAVAVVVDAAKGVRVEVEGREVNTASGRGTELVGLTRELTGTRDTPEILSRSIPFSVQTEAGREAGAVQVSIPIVPLRIDAPLGRITFEGPSFVLAGRVPKGASVLAAGHPIPVRADGSFAHTMNVSSVGQADVPVRAVMPGMAPRLATVGVRRVESLEVAARACSSAPELVLVASPRTPSLVGKAGAVVGEVLELSRAGVQTVVLVSAASCESKGDACRVRAVLGAELEAARGDTITVCGLVSKLDPVLELEAELAYVAKRKKGSK
jgi:hypothetical protein